MELDLEAAIGDAFKSITGTLEQDEDRSLEAAIGDAFKTITKPDTDKDDASLQAAISASLNTLLEEKPKDDEHDIAVDLAGIVQNVVLQMASGGIDTDEHKKEVPLLDDNVLAHFQLVAGKSDAEKEETIKLATQAALQKVRESHELGETDAEKLQMNEILQNAFSMAMRDPELLTSFEGEREAERPTEPATALSTAAAIAALSASGLMKRTEDTQEKEPKKPLSIAETLALHRSSQANAPRRDYSAISSLEESMRQENQTTAAPVHPQLSSILSSLSQHIQSGNQSQNIMLVIRQMTNALMLNKTSGSRLSSKMHELLEEVKSLPEEKEDYIDSLLRTRTFLTSNVSSELRTKSLSLIDNVLDLLAKDNSGNVDSSLRESKIEQDASSDVSDYFNYALSALSNFNSSRLRSAMLGTRPGVDSTEYKEKIRTDNRERKKRWREGNAERNKDNDLRLRVIKRANYMFGEESTEEKKAWIDDEFNKRREKRLAKQKKEESMKAESTSLPGSPFDDSKLAVVSFSQDPKLVKRVTDLFNLVAECGPEEDPQAVLTAASAATAVAASSYAKSLGMTDFKPIQGAMSRVLNNVLDSTVRSGSYRRIPFLSNGILSEESGISNIDNKDLFSRYSSLAAGLGAISQSAKVAMEAITNSQKRFGTGLLLNDFKKQKTDESSTLETDRSAMSRIESEIDQLKSSMFSMSAGNIWNSVTGLKMPKYKETSASNEKREFAVKQEESSSVQKPTFTSHRAGTPEAATPKPNGGLRKPGTFQKPGYGKPANSRNLGFPTLYSASFQPK